MWLIRSQTGYKVYWIVALQEELETPGLELFPGTNPGQAPTHTHRANLDAPIYLPCTLLDYGSKPESIMETHTNSTQKSPTPNPGTELITNHCASVPLPFIMHACEVVFLSNWLGLN